MPRGTLLLTNWMWLARRKSHQNICRNTRVTARQESEVRFASQTTARGHNVAKHMSCRVSLQQMYPYIEVILTVLCIELSKYFYLAETQSKNMQLEVRVSGAMYRVDQQESKYKYSM